MYAERVRRDDVSCARCTMSSSVGPVADSLRLSGQGWSDTRMAWVVWVDEPLMGRCFFDCVVHTRAPGPMCRVRGPRRVLLSKSVRVGVGE